MASMKIKDLSSVGRKHLHLIELDKDEELVYEIRKHPIGLVGIYLLGIFITTIIVGMVLLVVYALDGDRIGIGNDLSSLTPLAVILGMVLSVLSLILTGISAYLYQSNVVFVTTHKIAQVLYRNIFSRKISQLSIGDVQDVTTLQKGVLDRIFNYGTLIIETAGEQSNYTFTFTPSPYEATREIVNAHEENLKKYGN